MYRLAYEDLPKYERELGCKISILGGDTDSLFLSVTGKVDLYKDVYPAMIKNRLLDTSNYPPNHPLFSNDLNAKLGCIKDEFLGKMCTEVVFLAPKCYSFQLVGDKPKQACKGVRKGVLTHEDYRERYETKTELVKTARRMQSFSHHIYNIRQDKIALSFFENKRAWVGDNTSLPYGHFLLSD
jgi:hypothetical protein